jgi:regulator of protease activity HflC (stomatin/prohibitin superfamily)
MSGQLGVQGASREQKEEEARDYKLRIIYCALYAVAAILAGAWILLGLMLSGWSLWGFILSPLSCAIVAAAWVLWCVKKVPEDKRAVCVLFGIPRKICSPGPCFVIFPIEKLVFYPLKQQEIRVMVKNVTTNEGAVGDRKFGAASIEIDTNVYYHWDCLIKAVMFGPDPNDQAAIQRHFEEPIADAVKSICAGYTWFDIMKDQRAIQGAIADALTNQPEDPFLQAGVTREKIKITFPEVRIPKDLKDTLTAVEIERRKREAAEVKAETEANTIRVKGKAENDVKREAGKVEAENRADLYRVAKGAGIQFAMLEALVGMAQGKSNTILYGLPGHLQDFMNEHLNGKRPAEIIKTLQGLAPETLKEIINAMRAASPEAFDQLVKNLEADAKKES